MVLLVTGLVDPAPLVAEEGSTAGEVQEDRAAREELEKRLRALEAQVAALQTEIERLRAGSAAGMSDPLAELERRIQALTLEIERLRIGRAAAPEAEG